VGVAVALIVAIVVSRSGTERTPRSELVRRLSQGAEPSRFWFSYERGGTRVLDCALANLRFTGEVDSDGGRVVLRLPDNPAPVAVIDDASVLLHRSLFADPPFPADWLVFARPVDTAQQEALQRALGPDLAADVTAANVRASGRAIAEAALGVAASVERTSPATVDGRPADGYRITVDPERFATAATVSAPAAETRSASGAAPVPVIEVWVDSSNTVVRVAVRPLLADGSPGAPENGWTVDYLPIQQVDLPLVSPSDTSGAGFDLTLLTPAPRECRISG
jgi:hypothetical protein